MQTIKYIFADGTTSEIEVTNEFYTLYAELVQQEKRNHWKETRRHISLENLNENGIDFASPAADLLSVLIQQEDEKRIHLVLRYSRVVFSSRHSHFFLSVRKMSGKRSLWKRSPVGAVLCARMRAAARQRAF